MAQKTFTSAILTSADVNQFLAGEGGAWSSWSPTVTQSGSVTVTNTRSRFARYGRTIHFSISLVVTGSGVANNGIAISLPVTAAASGAVTGGTGMLFDTSTGLFRPFLVGPSSTTAFVVRGTAGGTGTPNLGQTGATFGAALAVNDTIEASGTYEAAS